jgi:patatin-like phospholipase/acyl hydrolase
VATSRGSCGTWARRDATAARGAQVEADTGRKVTELFDVICGSSTGGLLAMALLFGKLSPAHA